MKVVYASRTGNVESIISKLEIEDALKIEDGSETVEEDYILFTYTDGFGDVPPEVESFLENNGQNIKGVVVSGDQGYGEAYCKAGDVIAEQYNVPCLYKVENAGTDEDITKIKEKDFASFRRKNLGFIFQDFNLLDTLTIEENISLSLIINKANPSSIERRVHAIADKLGIRDILSKFPYEVSGGQKQRCACARALINEPNLILADEPTGALDSRSSRLLLETMSDINRKMHTTILMVTHDPFSASFCERILFLKDGKLFNEIFKGEKSRKEFFNEILDILTLLGGELGNVR